MAVFTKTCVKCKEEFAPYVQNINPDSDTCRDCLEDELEKFPIIPPTRHRRS